MAKTDRAQPGSSEPSRRRFMIAGEGVILRALAFDEMNLRKLRINVFDFNDRAKHVLETNGFVREGTLARECYRDGQYHDIVIYSTFKESSESMSHV